MNVKSVIQYTIDQGHRNGWYLQPDKVWIDFYTKDTLVAGIRRAGPKRYVASFFDEGVQHREVDEPPPAQDLETLMCNVEAILALEGLL